MEQATQHSLTNAVLPVNTQTMITTINRYAVPNGCMPWSTRDIPLFVHAPMIWKTENLKRVSHETT